MRSERKRKRCPNLGNTVPKFIWDQASKGQSFYGNTVQKFIWDQASKGQSDHVIKGLSY